MNRRRAPSSLLIPLAWLLLGSLVSLPIHAEDDRVAPAIEPILVEAEPVDPKTLDDADEDHDLFIDDIEPFDDLVDTTLWHQMRWRGALPIFVDTPDFDLYSTTLSGRDDRVFQWYATAETRAWTVRGSNARPQREWASATLSGAAGLWFTPVMFVQSRSTLIVPFLLNAQEGDDTDTLSFEDMQGHHRVRGMVGLGEPGEGSVGIDVEVDGRFDHSGAALARSRFTEVGPAGHTDAALNSTLWLRRGVDDEASGSLALGHHMRRVDYHDNVLTPIQGFTTHAISGGAVMRPTSRDVPLGHLQLVGVRWGRTRFDSHAADSCADLKSVCPNGLDTILTQLGDTQRIDLTVLEADRLVIVVDDELIVMMNTMLGGSWLWNDVQGTNVALFTAEIGMGTRWEYGSFGINASRRGNHSADGRRLVGQWRLELLAEFFIEEAFMGGASRATFHWLDDLNGQFGHGAAQHAIYSEWFFELFDQFLIGAFHRADLSMRQSPVTWDPWVNQGVWSHEMGGFIRWSVGD